MSSCDVTPATVGTAPSRTPTNDDRVVFALGDQPTGQLDRALAVPVGDEPVDLEDVHGGEVFWRASHAPGVSMDDAGTQGRSEPGESRDRKAVGVHDIAFGLGGEFVEQLAVGPQHRRRTCQRLAYAWPQGCLESGQRLVADTDAGVRRVVVVRIVPPGDTTGSAGRL